MCPLSAERMKHRSLKELCPNWTHHYFRKMRAQLAAELEVQGQGVSPTRASESLKGNSKP